MGNYDDNEEIFLEDYSREYLDSLDALTKDWDPDERDEVLGMMMERYNVRHSDNARVDAELNLLKSKSEYRKRQRRQFDPAVENFLRYVQKADGKSAKDVRKWAKSALKAPKYSYHR